ncbi:MAG: hypothetical protein ACI4KA_04745 [Oscillospiraceae bacterium]
MKRIINNRGSALAWGLCIMSVLLIISAAVLGFGVLQYNHALDEAAEQQALLLAQSGIRYAKDRIISAEITGDYSWQPDTEAFSLGILTNSETRTVYLDGKKRSENCAVIRYELVNHSGEELLKVESSAEINGKSASCCGLFSCEGGIWEFLGYEN